MAGDFQTPSKTAAADAGVFEWLGRDLEEVRCWQCRRLLLRADLAPGTVMEIRCPRCHERTTVAFAATA